MNAEKDSIHPEIIYVDSEKENVYVEAAMQWCSDVYSDNILGFANNIRTIDGGTHIEGLKTVLTRTFNTLAKKRGKRKDIEKNLAKFFSMSFLFPLFLARVLNVLVKTVFNPSI